jgi:hypothetical protein
MTGYRIKHDGEVQVPVDVKTRTAMTATLTATSADDGNTWQPVTEGLQIY